MIPSTRGSMLKAGIYEEKDSFLEISTKRVNIPMGSFKLMAECSLGFKEIKEKNSTKYSMYTYIYKEGWLFVQSILFKIDGEIFELISSNHIRDVVTGPYVEETNYYEINRKFIDKIANCKKLEIRIYGKDHYIEPEITRDGLSLIIQFNSKI
jgi:hypothetical protein